MRSIRAMSIYIVLCALTFIISSCGGNIGTISPAPSDEGEESTAKTVIITGTIMSPSAAADISKADLVSPKAASQEPAAGISGHVFTIQGTDLGSFITDANGSYTITVDISLLKPANATDDVWCIYIAMSAENTLKTPGQICSDSLGNITGSDLGVADESTTIATFNFASGCKFWTGEDCSQRITDDLSEYSASKTMWGAQSSDKLNSALQCISDFLSEGAVTDESINTMIACLQALLTDGGGDVAFSCPAMDDFTDIRSLDPAGFSLPALVYGSEGDSGIYLWSNTCWDYMAMGHLRTAPVPWQIVDGGVLRFASSPDYEYSAMQVNPDLFKSLASGNHTMDVRVSSMTGFTGDFPRGETCGFGFMSTSGSMVHMVVGQYLDGQTKCMPYCWNGGSCNAGRDVYDCDGSKDVENGFLIRIQKSDNFVQFYIDGTPVIPGEGLDLGASFDGPYNAGVFCGAGARVDPAVLDIDYINIQ